MSIKSHLFYIIGNDEVIGFEDLGKGKTFKPALNSLVLMIKGIYSNRKLPLAYFFFFCYSLSPFTTTGLSGTLRSAFFFSFFLCGAAGLRGTFPGYPRPPSLLLPPFSGVFSFII
jgi:hypothetical protein